MDLNTLEEERNRLSVEIPTWMFERGACGQLPVRAVPAVSCDALIALQVLLRTVPRPDPGGVLQAITIPSTWHNPHEYFRIAAQCDGSSAR